MMDFLKQTVAGNGEEATGAFPANSFSPAEAEANANAPVAMNVFLIKLRRSMIMYD
jgi:hypothetical protein